jgi:hypothetical protein
VSQAPIVPLAMKTPAGQTLHGVEGLASSSVAPTHTSSAHSLVDPGAAYWPGSHATHAVRGFESESVSPAAHVAHTLSEVSVGADVSVCPGVHLVTFWHADSWPGLALKVAPKTHARQTRSEDAVGALSSASPALQTVTGRHASAFVAFCQVEPRLQGLHWRFVAGVGAEVSLLPGWQSATGWQRVLWPCAGLYATPTLHGVHTRSVEAVGALASSSPAAQLLICSQRTSPLLFWNWLMPSHMAHVLSWRSLQPPEMYDPGAVQGWHVVQYVLEVRLQTPSRKEPASQAVMHVSSSTHLGDVSVVAKKARGE